MPDHIHSHQTKAIIIINTVIIVIILTTETQSEASFRVQRFIVPHLVVLESKNIAGFIFF